MNLRLAILAMILLSITVSAQSTRVLTIVSEPDAYVWIDDVAYGKTGPDGRLTFRTFSVGTHKLRVRALGFKEVTQNLLPSQKGTLKVALAKTTDEAELTFQRAELETDKEKAVELYEQAIKLRPSFPEAFVGLARMQANLNDTEAALAAIKSARRLRPTYAIASAVEGRIYKEDGQFEKAIASFKRAITEGRGIQPEAHTGLGLLYREKAQGFAAEGDTDSEIESYLIAASELRKAAAQLSGAPDAITIYQMLGDSYERADKWAEAIKVYREFLKIFPDSNEAEMFRSFITQAEKRLKGEQ